MERNGLAALAESFALDRAELYRLKLLNQHLFEHLCKELTLLSATAVSVVELSLRVEDYPEFSAGLSANAFSATVELDHRPVGIFGMQEEIAQALLWGNDAPPRDPETGEIQRKPLTKIEARVLADTVGGAMVRAFDQAFKPLFGVGAGVGRAHTDGPQGTAGALAGRGRLAIAAVECSVGDLRGSLHFGLLLSALLPVRAKLTRVTAERATVEENARSAPSSVMAANLELEAVLGNLTMPLNAIGALRPGAVIPLGKLNEKNPRLELRYAGQVVFYGTVVEDQGWRKFLVAERGFDRGSLRSEHLC
jgi:flagellar motor switch protein FliM